MMTNIQHYFPPDIVKSVCNRAEWADRPIYACPEMALGNVISLAAYRRKMMKEGDKVVS